MNDFSLIALSLESLHKFTSDFENTSYGNSSGVQVVTLVWYSSR